MLEPEFRAKLDHNLQSFLADALDAVPQPNGRAMARLDDIPVTIEFERDPGHSVERVERVLSAQPRHEIFKSVLTSSISTRCTYEELRAIAQFPEVKLIRLRINSQVIRSTGVP